MWRNVSVLLSLCVILTSGCKRNTIRASIWQNSKRQQFQAEPATGVHKAESTGEFKSNVVTGSRDEQFSPEQTQQKKMGNQEDQRFLTLVAKDTRISNIMWLVARTMFPKEPGIEPIWDDDIAEAMENAWVDDWLVKEKVTLKEFTDFVRQAFNLKFTTGNKRIIIRRADPSREIPACYKGQEKPPKSIKCPLIGDPAKRPFLLDQEARSKTSLWGQPHLSKVIQSFYDEIRFYMALYRVTITFHRTESSWTFFGFWPRGEQFELLGLPKSFTEGQYAKISPPPLWMYGPTGCFHDFPSFSLFSHEVDRPSIRFEVSEIEDFIERPVSDPSQLSGEPEEQK